MILCSRLGLRNEISVSVLRLMYLRFRVECQKLRKILEFSKIS